MTGPTLGRFAFGLASLMAFAGLTALVLSGWVTLASLDANIHNALIAFGHAHAGWVDAMTVVTHFGDTPTLTLIDAALVAFCLARRQRGLAVLVAAVAIGSWVARIGVRELVARPRPPDAFWPETMASYPSGHATNATVTVGLILLVIWPAIGRTGRVVAVAGAVSYAFAVGFSRVAGGVHWPSDVVGGWLLGIGIVVTVAALEARRRSS